MTLLSAWFGESTVWGFTSHHCDQTCQTPWERCAFTVSALPCFWTFDPTLHNESREDQQHLARSFLASFILFFLSVICSVMTKSKGLLAWWWIRADVQVRNKNNTFFCQFKWQETSHVWLRALVILFTGKCAHWAIPPSGCGVDWKWWITYFWYESLCYSRTSTCW